jgi:methylenetetrahydromethanopterin dehydrogenase
MVTVTFVRVGYIATSTLIDALLDERAARNDIKIRIISSGVKMDEAEAEEVAKIAAGVESDLYVLVSPNAGLDGPKKLREVLKETGKPMIVVSDEPSRKAAQKLPAEGIGYMVLYGDPMISAKSAFLDPVEMAIFNADAIKVLAVTGVWRLVHTALDKVIDQLKAGETPELPELVIDKTLALQHSDLQNPYAYAKAMAAHEAARQVAKLSTEGVFKTEDRNEAIPILAAAHELMRHAAELADEARELEKANDSVVRIAHFTKGDRRKKTELFGKHTK